MRLDTIEKRLQWRFIPKDAVKLEGTNCVAYLYEGNGKPCAIGFIGTAGRSDFHLFFRDAERRLEYVNEWRKRIEAHEQHKLERKAARKAFVNPLKVGDILYSSWGYEQTNIDFYQVTESKGKYVTVRQICADSEETGWLQGVCTPRKDDFCVYHENPERYKPLRRIVKGTQEHPYISIESYATASLWDGKPKHWTAYY